MKRYLFSMLLVLMLVCTASRLIHASIDLMYSDVQAHEPDQTVHVRVVLNSDRLVETASFEYWWDQQIHTYPLPEGAVPDCPLNLEVVLDSGQIPLDQPVFFRVTAADSAGDSFIWNGFYFDWRKSPHQQLTSEHVTMRYKGIPDAYAQEYLQTAERAFQNLTALLRIEHPQKIDLEVFGSYDQFYTEDEPPTAAVSGLYSHEGQIRTIFSPKNRMDFQEVIVHEMVHDFQFSGLYPFTLLDHPKAMWFSDMMAQYITVKLIEGDEFIEQSLREIQPAQIEWLAQNPYWRYRYELSFLFFHYLFDKYSTTDIVEVTHQFINSDDMNSAEVPADFIAYLASHYQIRLDLDTVGRRPLTVQATDKYKLSGYCYRPRTNQLFFSHHYNFSRSDVLAEDISLLNLEDHRVIPFTTTWQAESAACIAPAGQYIYYIQQYGGRYAVIQQNIESRQNIILYDTQTPIFNLSVSPNEERIAFTQHPHPRQSDLWLLSLSDGKLEQITSGINVSSVYFRTDTILYYVSTGDQTVGISFFDLSSRESYLIPNTGEAWAILDFNRDSCLYLSGKNNYRLCLLDLSTLVSKELMDAAQCGKIWFPRLTPSGLFFFEGDTVTTLTPNTIPLP